MKDWTILVVDEEADSRRHVAETLRSAGYDVREAEDGTAALSAIRAQPPDLVALDLALTSIDPNRLIQTLVQKDPEAIILVTTRQQETPDQVRSFQADDFLQKPVDASELLDRVKRLMTRQAIYRTFRLVGKNDRFVEAVEQAIQIAPTQIQVLLTGESGTGKDIIARAIHQYSPRRDAPFVPVNCGAIAEGIIESELFGHERGSFTGATGRREGYFEQANGGTIFLDELGEMPLATQIKLLRVLEQQEFLRVGGTKPIRTDVRLIAATNKDLHEAIRNGSFRSDLYFRLNAVSINLPALRERKDDIPRLIHHFVSDAVQKHKTHFAGFTDDALTLLRSYDWPGNIRELRNVIETLVVTAQGRRVRPADLPTMIYGSPGFNRALPVPVNRNREDLEREMLYKILWEIRTSLDELPTRVVEALRGNGPRPLPERFVIPAEDRVNIQPEEAALIDLRDQREAPLSMDTWEREAIRQALDRNQGHRESAARDLGIGERTLYRKIKKYGLDGA